VDMDIQIAILRTFLIIVTERTEIQTSGWDHWIQRIK